MDPERPISGKTASVSLAVLNACHPGAWLRVGGIPLTARTLFHLTESGIERVALFLEEDRIPEDLERWEESLDLYPKTVRENIPKGILSIPDLTSPFVYVDTAHLIDPRLLRTLVAASECTLASMDPEDRKKGSIRAGFMRKEDLLAWVNEGPPSLIRGSRALFPVDMDPYCPEIRGSLSPYFIEVRSENDAREATWKLIRSQQKKVMDLPAQYIDPFFENGLTRLLCDTPITPNVVTLAGVLIAAGVAWLFWHGYFLAGALTAFLVEIFDGVDGKLARTKLCFSKLGEYENVIDYFCENSWYVALAMGLRTVGPAGVPGILAALLILSDTVDNILYTLADRWHGKSIDLFSPFDAAFRRIAGRRNIYGMIFVFGFLVGYPLYTFAVAAVWAAMTAAIHGLRLFGYGRRLEKRMKEEVEGF